MSQRQLALMISMDKSYLSGVETGNRNATVGTLEKIADGLDVTLESLFKGVE